MLSAAAHTLGAAERKPDVAGSPPKPHQTSRPPRPRLMRGKNPTMEPQKTGDSEDPPDEDSGIVLAAEECKPIPNARIEFWLANPRGGYDDSHRATVFAGERGGYRLESNVPVSYGGRPPYVHVRVRGPGYKELVTQPLPRASSEEGELRPGPRSVLMTV
jgi:hypothetical protein